MQVIHLAHYGYEYQQVQDAAGRPSLRVVKHHIAASETLCGEKVATKAIEVIADHSSPATCRKCLRALPKRKTDQVRPMMWSVP